MESLFKEFDWLFERAEWGRAILLLNGALPLQNFLRDEGQNLLAAINALDFPAPGNTRLQMGARLLHWKTEVQLFLTDAPGERRKNGSMVFVSHTAKDADIANDFVNHFLREGLEIPFTEIFSMSHPATAIVAGDDFRKSIHAAIHDAKVVFFLVSENFKQSQFCLAEMGAAWSLGKSMVPICIPPFDKTHSGELLGTLQYVEADNKAALGRLRDQLVQHHAVGKIQRNSVLWQMALDGFMEKVKQKLAVNTKNVR